MKKRTIVALVFLCFFLPIKAQVYVSTTGLDASGRGSAALPYKTISYAVSQSASGNTVYISPGSYFETNVIYIGTALTLVKNGVGNVIIEGTSRTATDDYLLGISDASNVVVDGLIFQNYIRDGAKGISIVNSGNNITIKNCKFTNIGWINNNLISAPSSDAIIANAIAVRGSKTVPLTNILIQNNEVSNCATGWGEAVTIGANVDGFLVENNIVHHNSNIGIDVTGNYAGTGAPSNLNQPRNGKITNNEVYNCMSSIANSSGIYLDGALNCTVEKNKSYNNGVGIAVGGEQSVGVGASQPSGNKVMNNLVYNNCVTGIFLGTATAGVFIQSTTVYNNTFYKNRTGEAINGVTTINGFPLSDFSTDLGGEISLQNINGVTFKNNIVYPINSKKGMITYSGYTVSSFISDYNVYFRDNTVPIFALRGVNFNGITGDQNYNTIADFTTATSLESHSLFLNPGFTNAGSNDFSLTNTASAINKGDPTYDSNISGLTDFIGNTRKISIRIDAGAYENQTPILPVTFVSLKAYRFENEVKIEWTTASEVHNSHFDIEKSEEGASFITIGRVKSAGNKTPLSHYVFVDSQPHDGIQYYRIKQVDLDGKTTLTNVVSVSPIAHTKLQIFPNPVKDKLTIITVSQGEYSIADVFGREILRGPILDNHTEIDVSYLPVALYFVKTKEGMVRFFKD
jgi:hypothetical protein